MQHKSVDIQHSYLPYIKTPTIITGIGLQDLAMTYMQLIAIDSKLRQQFTKRRDLFSFYTDLCWIVDILQSSV